MTNGFILHGTTRKIKELTPNKANDLAKESGNRTAIYMTNIPPLAMFKALIGGIDNVGWSKSGASTQTVNGQTTHEVKFGMSRPELVADTGYVYVMDAASADEYVGGEYLAYNPVKPLIAVEIRQDDFRYPVETLTGVPTS